MAAALRSPIIKRQISFRANLKPVMVWIYGGAWYVGTSDMYPGYNLALNGDVIVISYNYRLNVSVTVLNNRKLLLQATCGQVQDKNTKNRRNKSLVR